MMSITKSTACPPIWNPKLPPSTTKNAGALHPFGVRQLASPRPYFPPKTKPPFSIDGTTPTPPHRWPPRHALSPAQNILRNARIRRRLDFVQNLARSLRPIHSLRFLWLIGSPRHRRERYHHSPQQKSFHMPHHENFRDL